MMLLDATDAYRHLNKVERAATKNIKWWPNERS